jgi:hypothetical protein
MSSSTPTSEFKHQWNVTRFCIVVARSAINHERFPWHGRRNKRAYRLQLSDYFKANSALVKVDAGTTQGGAPDRPATRFLALLARLSSFCLVWARAWHACMEGRNDRLIMAPGWKIRAGSAPMFGHLFSFDLLDTWQSFL